MQERKNKKIYIILFILMFMLVLSVIGAIAVNAGMLSYLNFSYDNGSDLHETETKTQQTSGVQTTEATSEPATGPVAPVVHNIPGSVRGIWLVAGEDYYLNGASGNDRLKSEIDGCLDYISAQKYINTVILPVDFNGRNILENEIVKYITQKCREKKLCVLAATDLFKKAGPQDGQLYFDINDDQEIKALKDKFIKLSELRFDGVMVSGLDKSVKINENNQERVEGLLRDLKNILQKENPNIYFCHNIQDDSYVYNNGAITADNLDLKLNELFDGVFIDIFQPVDQTKYSFDKIAGTWNSLLKTGSSSKEYYINHSLFKTGGRWDSPDQIINQLVSLFGSGAKGSTFYSLSGLKANNNQIAELLNRHYSGNIKPQYISNELKITSPTATAFSTYDSKISFKGGSDPNFPLTLNGANVERTENGNFSVTYDLKTGGNVFVFENKGKKITYTVDARIVILKNVTPLNKMTLNGETQVTLSALAQDGATVYALLGGRRIEMGKAESVNQDDASSGNGSFVYYYGSYTLPKSTSVQQELGSIKFYATYKGVTESKQGGSITVDKAFTPPQIVTEPTTKPATKPTTKPTTKPNTTQPSTQGTGPTTKPSTQPTTQPPATEPVQIPKAKGLVAEITANQAKTFNGKTVDDWARPDFNFYPKGTVDFVLGNEIVYQGSSTVKYRLLASGRRVYSNEIKTYTTSLYTQNILSVASCESDNSFTYLTLNTLWKAPFNLEISPQTYSNPYPTSGSSMPQYGITAPTATYVDLDFKYATKLTGDIDFADNSVFKSFTFIKTDGGYTLRLYLKKTGSFYGYRAEYNAKDQLVIRFLNSKLPQPSTNSFGYTLNGVKIVLDAGHGGSDAGALGSIEGYHEKQVNLSLALKIRDRLTALGANVIMTRTGDTTIDSSGRTNIILANKPDLAISVHHNSSTSSAAYGFESYYYSPMSFAFSKSVYEEVLKEYKGTIYANNSTRKAGCGRGSKYYPFFYTRTNECPSILVEYGFMSNVAEYELFIDPANQEALADGTVRGIIHYLKNR